MTVPQQSRTSHATPIWRELAAPIEALDLLLTPRLQIARGQGEPAVLVPGLLAGDTSLLAMLNVLRRHDHAIRPARIGINVDCAALALTRLERRVEAIAHEHGPVSLVGHSRGGILSRALAVSRPDLIGRLITFGAPVRDQLAIHPLLLANVRILARLGGAGVPYLFSDRCLDGRCCAEVREHYAAPVPDPVHYVAIYSPRDGLVAPAACMDPGANLVEVSASHVGMVANRAVCQAVAHALTQPLRGRGPDHATPAGSLRAA